MSVDTKRVHQLQGCKPSFQKSHCGDTQSIMK